MEMKQLQYFVVSVDTGSLSRAAKMLYTTQPHVSMTIQKLEKSLGVQLLQRSKQGVVMTKEGEEVYERARKILSNLQEIQNIKTAEETEELRISAIPSHGIDGLFTDFCQRREIVQGQFLEGSQEEVLRQVIHRHSDLGFLFLFHYQQKTMEQKFRQRQLEFYGLKDTRMVLFVGPKNPYYGKKSIKRTELGTLHYIHNIKEGMFLFQYPGHLREEIMDAHSFQGGMNSNSSYANGQLLLKTEMGYLGTCLDAGAYSGSPIHMLELEDFKSEVSFGYVRRSNRMPGRVSEEFLGYIRERL